MAQPDFSFGSGSAFSAVTLPAILSRNATMVEEFEASDLSHGKAGFEKRVAGQSTPLAEIDLGPGIRTLLTLRLLRSFYRQQYGPINAFLFHHFLIHTTAVPANLKDRRPGAVTMLDQQFGVGDGLTTACQLSVSHNGVPEDVYKPKVDIVSPLIAVAGVLQDPAPSPPDYTLDLDPATSRGVVTFTTPPAGGALLTWGGHYSIITRFRDKRLDINFENYDRGIASVILKQVRDVV